MKLRNKKTGEVIDEENYRFQILERADQFYGCETYDEVARYKSIKELSEEWEDYESAEPLIKDEKIRKVVRAWAEANSITQVSYDAGWNSFRCSEFVISFDYDFDRHDGLEDEKSYTIAELCGEEEE